MPLLWLSLAFVLGIWLGNVLAWSLAAWLAIALGCLLVFALLFLAARRGLHLPAFPRRLAVRFQGLPRPPLPPAILVGVFFLGALRMALAQPAFNDRSLVNFNDHPERLIIDGVLVEPPEVRDNKTLLRVEALQYRLASDPQLHPAEGRLLARSADYTDFHYGDRLRLEGFLETLRNLKISPTAPSSPAPVSLAICPRPAPGGSAPVGVSCLNSGSGLYAPGA